MSMHEDNFVTFFKALGDKTRLDIVRTIAHQPKDTASWGEARTCSSLSQPAMSHHFKKLVEAGVILESKAGTEKSYEINHDLFNRLGINPDKL
jgi:ArsR family transcriptional regulator